MTVQIWSFLVKIWGFWRKFLYFDKLLKIDLLEVSDVSAMPSGLLNPMTKEEVLDLVAYLLSGGDESHRYFTD